MRVIVTWSNQLSRSKNNLDDCLNEHKAKIKKKMYKIEIIKWGEMEKKWGVELKTTKNFIFYVNSKAA